MVPGEPIKEKLASPPPIPVSRNPQNSERTLWMALAPSLKVREAMFGKEYVVLPSLVNKVKLGTVGVLAAMTPAASNNGVIRRIMKCVRWEMNRPELACSLQRIGEPRGLACDKTLLKP